MNSRSEQVLAHLYAGDRPGAQDAADGTGLDVFAASALGCADAVEDLVKANPGAVSLRTSDGFTALHLAAFFGTAATVSVLLQAGASAAAVASNATRVTPLHSAVAQGKQEAVALLLDAGAPVDAQQAGGYTALHAAAAQGSDAIVQLLVAAGAQLDVRDDKGWSAAEHAGQSGHPEIAMRLIPTEAAG